MFKKEKKCGQRIDRNKKLYKLDNNSHKKTNNNLLVKILCCSLMVNAIFALYLFNSKMPVSAAAPEKVEVIKEVVPENIVFLGDSITDYYDLYAAFSDRNVVNSGIAGDLTSDILEDMDNRVYQYNPSKVFLLIGTNDIEHEVSKDEIVDNIKKIIEGIKENRENAEIYLESIYPVNEDKWGASLRRNAVIKEINEELEELAEEEDITYIDLFDDLAADDENLKDEVSDDGLHLLPEGYDIVTEKLENYL